MELITFESDAFNALIKKIIAEINCSPSKNANNNPLSETWLDLQETCQLLKISKRTLQAYRDNGILPHSKIAGKIYFRAIDIEEHLQKHYVKSFNSNK